VFEPAKTIAAAAFFVASAAGLVGASAEDGPTLEKIKASGAITIGYREAAIPFSYLGPDQKPIGFSLDLCGLVAEKIKQELGLAELKIDAKPVAPANRAALVKEGAVDLECGATPESADLARDAAFSIPIYASELRWIVPGQIRVEREGARRNRYEVRRPTTSDDLRNKTVALTQGSPAMPAVLAVSVERYLGLSILQGKDAADAFKLVETGKAQAFIDDDVLLVGLKASAKNPDAFGFLDESFPGTAYALVMRKGDKPFKDLVDSVLSEAMKSGEYEKLYAKWFESPIPSKNVNLAYPMSEAVKQLIKKPEAASN
jgi:glutamate/aspartate transport system substrate-binding protein